MSGRQSIADAQRVVIKIGSALLVDPDTGAVHRRWLESLATDVAAMRKRGQQVLIVSSGAIAVGRRHLDLAQGHLRLHEQQAAAATGMIRLAHAYQEVLEVHDLSVAQVLLTLDDSENRRRYINARNTLETLLKVGALPLINENDTVATDEIRVGDNDRLAARVTAMVSADLLVLLSDIDGLYTADPRGDTTAEPIPLVEHEITPEIEAMAGNAASEDSRGGMVTKIAAGRIAMRAGARMIIGDGREDHPIKRLEDGARATWFLPKANPRTARKEWIAGALKTTGAFVVDAGAEKALAQGKSLLPAGVTAVEGEFQRGEAVAVKTADDREIGRGLAAYPAADARRLCGHKTSEIETLLGYRGRDEMIHRDDLVVH